MKLIAALGIRIDCDLLDGIVWQRGNVTATPGAFTFPPTGSSDDA
jgi:hypothetical protein